MVSCSINEVGDDIINETINNNDLIKLDWLLRIYITVKMSNPYSSLSDELMKNISSIYCMACKQGKKQIIDVIVKYNTIRNNMPRYDVLHGISLTIHEKDVSHFTLLMNLINVFNITRNEILGDTFNLLQYCIVCDNVDALHYLYEKFKIDFKTMDKFQKDIMLDAIVFNTSRNVLKYLYNTKKITQEDISSIPYTFINNKIFLRELITKYQYNIPEYNDILYKKEDDLSKIYKAPHNRKYCNYPIRSSYKIFNEKQYNRSDKDRNWRTNKPIMSYNISRYKNN